MEAPNQNQSESSSNKGLSRRGFLKGVFGLGSEVVLKTGFTTAALKELINEWEREQGMSARFNQIKEQYQAKLLTELDPEVIALAFDREEEPELFAALERGEIKTELDIANYFAGKPVVGAEEYSRAEYVAQAIEFDSDVPENVQDELRKWLPGLCAQESKFNNNAESAVGAKGIFQFMPNTWEEVSVEIERRTGESPSIMSLKDQTVGAGIHFSNIYKRLQHYSDKHGGVLDKIRQAFFKDNDDVFAREFLVPVMTSAYHAGSKRLVEVTLAFTKELLEQESVTEYLGHHPLYLGHDLFLVMAQFAAEEDEGAMEYYGENAKDYSPKVYAFAELIQEAQSKESATV